ncbi:MAG TPA: NUDIX domain-containing protein [Candidatus Dormibacteraeota bacterium]|nr:NUDIX domain-containing protein [Candidatus Dormibacteraeota bacterium]
MIARAPLDLRARVERQVASLPPPADLRERRSRRLLLAGLGRLRQPFQRLAGPVHVTGSAIVAGGRGTLLHRHRRLGTWLQPGGHLEPGETPSQAALREAQEETGLELRLPPRSPRLVHVDVHPAPGGHVHPGARPKTKPDLWGPCTPSPALPPAVLAHALEGARCAPRRRHRIWGTWTPNLSARFPAALLDLRYLLLGPDVDPCPPPGESQEVRWFTWPEAVRLADPGLAGALRRLAPV